MVDLVDAAMGALKAHAGEECMTRSLDLCETYLHMLKDMLSIGEYGYETTGPTIGEKLAMDAMPGHGQDCIYRKFAVGRRMPSHPNWTGDQAGCQHRRALAMS